MKKILGRLRGHFQEYVARYSVLVLAVLVPASGLAGAAAADLGGVDTPVGRALLAIAAALGTAASGVTFIKNLGVWQMLDSFGTAPHVQQVASRPLEPAVARVGHVLAPDADDSVHAVTDGEPYGEVKPDEAVGSA